jgi:hypothetical protein
MRRPSARVGRNRRRAYLYAPAGLLGTFLVFGAPAVNGAYLVGALLLLFAAGAFVLGAGPVPAGTGGPHAARWR